MTMLFELLYHYWCVPYDRSVSQEYLDAKVRSTPMGSTPLRGFKLGPS